MLTAVVIRYAIAIKAKRLSSYDLSSMIHDNRLEYDRLMISIGESRRHDTGSRRQSVMIVHRLSAIMAIHKFDDILMSSKMIRRLVFCYDMRKYEDVVVKSVDRLEAQFRKNVEQILEDVGLSFETFAHWTREVIEEDKSAELEINSFINIWLDSISERYEGPDLSVNEVCNILNSSADSSGSIAAYQPKNTAYQNTIREAVYSDIIFKDYGIEVEVVRAQAKLIQKQNSLLFQGMPSDLTPTLSSKPEIKLTYTSPSN